MYNIHSRGLKSSPTILMKVSVIVITIMMTFTVMIFIIIMISGSERE